jgi:response regulator RpfG family c-di-GMP phosphodiesterase
MFEEGAGRPRILVVDDEPEIRNVLCDLLGRDYTCLGAASAEAALLILHREQFHLVISDINMSGMSGLEMIPFVQKNRPETLVLVISGLQTIESAIEALRLGAFDYIMKPFDLRQVEQAVRRAVEHYELRVAKRRYELHLEEMVQKRTLELNEALESLQEAYRSTLKALTAALETRDHETHGHSERVVTFSLRLGREYGLNPEQLLALEFGSLLHDIGKIGVPDAILRKPSPLTEAEWEQMREHPLHGQQILSGIEFLAGAARVVAQHHERWDGTGYPLGLSGEEIDLNARIFQVADAFDAITSDRVYRKSKSYEAAAAELDDWAGRQFDPRVVEAFHRVPPEDWNQLRRRSLIKSQHRSTRHRPVVKLLEAKLNALAS